MRRRLFAITFSAALVAGADEVRPPPVEPPVRDVPPTARPAAAGVDVPMPPPGQRMVTPDPGALGVTSLWATPQLGWRSYDLSPGPAGASISSPYPGLSLGASWRLPEGWTGPGGLSWTLQGAYGYAPLRLESAGQQEWRAGEHRLRAELEGSADVGAAGRLGVAAGVAWEALLTPGDAPLPSVQHLSPRLGLSWSRALPAGLALRVEGGVRPWASVGGDAEGAWGAGSSTGWDAAAGLSGPLWSGDAGALRWTAGYELLQYQSTFAAAAGGGPTRLDEQLHRVGIGVAWQTGP